MGCRSDSAGKLSLLAEFGLASSWMIRLEGQGAFRVRKNAKVQSFASRNDGTVKDVTYFTCPPNHGIFVRPAQVTLVPVTTGRVSTSSPGSPTSKAASPAPTSPARLSVRAQVPPSPNLPEAKPEAKEVKEARPENKEAKPEVSSPPASEAKDQSLKAAAFASTEPAPPLPAPSAASTATPAPDKKSASPGSVEASAPTQPVQPVQPAQPAQPEQPTEQPAAKPATPAATPAVTGAATPAGPTPDIVKADSVRVEGLHFTCLSLQAQEALSLGMQQVQRGYRVEMSDKSQEFFLRTEAFNPPARSATTEKAIAATEAAREAEAPVSDE